MPTGLPPRVRGNPGRRYATTRQPPAYPRACGATVPVVASRAAALGLPPRVRGNHARGAGPLPRPGPTPARAGQP